MVEMVCVCVGVGNNATGGTTGLYTAQRLNGLWVVVDYFSGLCVCASADRISGGIWDLESRCEKWATKIGLGKWSIGTAFVLRNVSMSPSE